MTVSLVLRRHNLGRPWESPCPAQSTVTSGRNKLGWHLTEDVARHVAALSGWPRSQQWIVRGKFDVYKVNDVGSLVKIPRCD